MSETTTPLSYVTPTYFDILSAYGSSLTAVYGTNVDVEILNVFALDGGQLIDITSQNLFEVEQDTSSPYKFKLRTTSGTYFTFDNNSANDQYKFVFKVTVNKSPENVVNNITVNFNDFNPNTYSNILQNAYPTVVGATLIPNGSSLFNIPSGQWPTEKVGQPNTFYNLYEFDSANGTANPSVSEYKKYVNWEVNKIEFYWNTVGLWIEYGSGGGGTIAPAVSQSIQFVSNTTIINEQLQFAKFLRCLNPDGTTLDGGVTNSVYNLSDRKDTQFRASVTVRDINSSSYGSLGYGIGTGVGNFYIYFTMKTTN